MNLHRRLYWSPADPTAGGGEAVRPSDSRWTREYLPTIQHRQKWLRDSPNTHVGDIVLVMDELTHRNHWPMGRIVKVNVGRDGVIRSCDIKTEKGCCTRPVTKLCLLDVQ